MSSPRFHVLLRNNRFPQSLSLILYLYFKIYVLVLLNLSLCKFEVRKKVYLTGELIQSCFPGNLIVAQTKCSKVGQSKVATKFGHCRLKTVFSNKTVFPLC